MTVRPNVLVICTDQQRFDAMGAYGNPEIHTPALDRLAAEGVLFENCYVQSPVCGPSRASLMTGRYVHNHGLWANGVGLPEHERLFTRELADAGYDCGLVGKFHLNACFGGRTERRVDDGIRAFHWAHDPYTACSENQYHRWLRAAHPGVYEAARDPESPMSLDTVPAEAHYSRWISDETVEFLRNGREREKPFCFIANFFDPHHGFDPLRAFDVPKEYVDRYRAADLSRPRTKPGELTEKPPIYTEASQRSYAGHARGYAEYTPEELQEGKAAYYGMVTLIDDEIGRMLAALDEQGLRDNTLVLFTSDHGEMLGDHQLMLKGPMMYECAVRVPLVLRWPAQLRNGQQRAELVQWIDLSATILDAAGLPPLRRGQGTSLLPLARGQKGAWTRDWALSEYRNSGHPYDPPVHTTMLRQDRWKIVVHHGPPATERTGAGELYDLKADPDELTNLWDEPRCLQKRSTLQAQLLDVLVATEDRSQQRDAFW